MASESFIWSQAKSIFRQGSPVAAHRDGVPLLWVGMCRPGNARRSQSPDGPLWRFVVAREQAERQLRDALPLLAQAFPGRGSLEEHAAWLLRALDEQAGDWIAVDCDEIQLADNLTGAHLRRILRWFGDPALELQEAETRRHVMSSMSRADKVRYVREWIEVPVKEVLSRLESRDDDPVAVARELMELRTPLQRKRDDYAAWRKGLPNAPELSITELLNHISGLVEGPWVSPPDVGDVLDQDPEAAWRLAALIGREDEFLTPWERAWKGYRDQ